MVTKGVISLKTHRGTSYNTFVGVLNEITAGGNEVKNMASLKYFSKEFEDLSKLEKEVINDVAPAVISESEPDKIN